MRIVIPSVQYADFLEVTLPRWQAMFTKAAITVVTSPADRASAAVAAARGVECVVTDAWTRPAATHNAKKKAIKFNKAAALDEAFGFTGSRLAPDEGERCLSVDADVVPFGTMPRQNDLDRRTLYGVPRYHCETPTDLEAHTKGRVTREALRLLVPRQTGDRQGGARVMTPEDAAAKCLGYCQVFRYRVGLSFGSFATAGGYDTAFRRHFTRRAALPGFYVLHLGDSDRRNWTGRVVPAWRA